MSGQAIITALLNASAEVATLVGERCYPIDAPEDVELPALSYRTISRSQRDTVGLAESVMRVTERVEVTPMCSDTDYSVLERMARAIRKACGNQAPTSIAGCTAVQTLNGYSGPELHDQDRHIYLRPIDFLVTFNEPVT